VVSRDTGRAHNRISGARYGPVHAPGASVRTRGGRDAGLGGLRPRRWWRPRGLAGKAGSPTRSQPPSWWQLLVDPGRSQAHLRPSRLGSRAARREFGGLERSLVHLSRVGLWACPRRLPDSAQVLSASCGSSLVSRFEEERHGRWSFSRHLGLQSQRPAGWSGQPAPCFRGFRGTGQLHLLP
jgi:hypothetical protein